MRRSDGVDGEASKYWDIGSNGSLAAMTSPFDVRVYGDPVLRAVADEVTDIDGALAALADDMLATMYAEPGIGLAAPQIGVGKRLFVYDLGGEDGRDPKVIVNPVITESDGEWFYTEGCLSVPGLSWEIRRPKLVHITGYDLDGNEVSVEADELEARLFQHELDHLDGVLLVDHLEGDTKAEAMTAVRERFLAAGARRSPSAAPTPPPKPGLTLP